MPEDWETPEQVPSSRVIYGPRGEKLRVFKEVGRGDTGFRLEDESPTARRSPEK